MDVVKTLMQPVSVPVVLDIFMFDFRSMPSSQLNNVQKPSSLKFAWKTVVHYVKLSKTKKSLHSNDF